jgi:phosphoglycerol transferase MdoB-like AlkP superfamily enzyme
MTTATTHRRQSDWIRINALFLVILFLGLGIFLAGRLAMLHSYGEPGVVSKYTDYLLNDLLYGSRLDLKILAIAIAPAYLLFLIIAMTVKSWLGYFYRLLRPAGFTLLMVCALFAAINYHYYAIFGNHIDVFIFDFFQWENAREVLKTIWIDFSIPVLVLQIALTALLLWYALGVLPPWLAGKYPFHVTRTHQVAVALICTVLIAASARGAITARPLSVTRASLSPDVFFNKLVPNGLVAFYDASKRNKKKMKLKAVSDEELRQAFAHYYPDRAIPPVITPEDLLTRTTLQEQPPLPNVVLSLMESFGARLLTFHSKDNNVYGALEPHAGEDYFFTRFTSASTNTARSLEKVMLGHAFSSSVSSSSYRNVDFLASPARLFAAKGYRTIFITSGRKTWANIDAFMKQQGFEEIYDEYAVLSQVEGATGGRTWGVYDEYSYAFIRQLLEQSHDKPLFIVLLTITNHSPFEPPDDYEGYPVNIEAVMPHTALTDHDKMHSIVRTYQYANNSLGEFISSIKDNPELAKSTIIAASGDHELRYIFNTRENETAWKYRVPFYLYLPPGYREGTVNDHERFGSHRDIFPTIYNRIFAETPYYDLGVDLLAADFNHERAFSMNDRFVMNSDGGIYDEDGTRILYHWQDDRYDQLEVTDSPSRGLRGLASLEKTYTSVIRAFTRMQIDARDARE